MFGIGGAADAMREVVAGLLAAGGAEALPPVAGGATMLPSDSDIVRDALSAHQTHSLDVINAEAIDNRCRSMDDGGTKGGRW